MPLSSNLLDTNGHTVTAYGSPAIVSVGGYSGVQFGPNKGLLVPIAPQIGSKNFNVTFYMYRVAGNGSDWAMTVGNYVGGGMVGVYINGNASTMSYVVSPYNSTGVSYTAFASGATYNTLVNKWVKVELKRTNGALEIVMDGVSRGSFIFTQSAEFVYGDHGNAGGLMIGCLDNSSSSFAFNGYDSTSNLYIREVTFEYT